LEVDVSTPVLSGGSRNVNRIADTATGTVCDVLSEDRGGWKQVSNCKDVLGRSHTKSQSSQNFRDIHVSLENVVKGKSTTGWKREHISNGRAVS
jgi:hypothetical protein